MISIVIPTYNRPEMLVNSLDCFLYENQGLSNKDYEVIISDDSSNADTKNLVESKYPFFRYNSGPKQGPAANRNNGASKANGEWVMFIDDDCIPSKDIVKNYIKSIAENPDVKVFEGSIMVDRPKRHYLEESPINLTGGYMWSCNFMIDKSVFIDVLKGFDEKFPFAAMEDVDVHVRLKKANQKIKFVKSASVIHPWRLQEKMIEMTEKRIKSEQYFYAKHPELMDRPNAVARFKNKLRFYYKIAIKVFAFRGRGLITILKAQQIIDKYHRERAKL